MNMDLLLTTPSNGIKYSVVSFVYGLGIMLLVIELALVIQSYYVMK